MHRRHFLQSVGLAGAAQLAANAQPAAAQQPGAQPPTKAKQPGKAPIKSWMFFDLWHLDRWENIELKQATADWQRDDSFVDPACFGLNSWPTVYRDEASGRWRMLYSALWKPYSLMIAQSDDGRTWKPLPQPDVHPGGKKLAANHLFTLEGGSGGGVYLDPVAADGYPFKAYCHQQQQPVFERALKDPAHRWHQIAKTEGVKRYMSEELTAVSRDGLHWQLSPDYGWGLPDWHPEPPLFGFYDAARGEHVMTVRPGWGDRRVTIQSTSDFKTWSGPEPLLQPDPLDGLVQFYGMPVAQYDHLFVGLPWIFHCASAEPIQAFNQFVGTLDGHLAYSYNGRHFHRAMRQPLIPLNEPGEHGCACIQPACLVQTDDEIRIYSCSSRIQHGRSRATKNARDRELYAILLHTLRKDGFLYLESGGNWGSFTSKPLVLFEPQLTLNARAPFGEVRYQLTDVENNPLPGFTFADCRPLAEGDELAAPMTFGQHKLDEVLGKPIRLEVRFRDARLYAFRGAWHFLDAQDLWMLRDGKPIDPTLFDF